MTLEGEINLTPPTWVKVVLKWWLDRGGQTRRGPLYGALSGQGHLCSQHAEPLSLLITYTEIFSHLWQVKQCRDQSQREWSGDRARKCNEQGMQLLYVRPMYVEQTMPDSGVAVCSDTAEFSAPPRLIWATLTKNRTIWNAQKSDFLSFRRRISVATMADWRDILMLCAILNFANASSATVLHCCDPAIS